MLQWPTSGPCAALGDERERRSGSMASGMDYGLRPEFFKFECRKFDGCFKFDVEPSNVWPLARTAVADSRNFQACGLCSLFNFHASGNSHPLARF